MKKIIALALVLVFTIALAVPAFAADITGVDSNDALSNGTNNEAKVTYDVAGSYTVSVPATLVADGAAQEVSAANVVLYRNTQLVVTVTYSGFLKVDGDAATNLAYTINKAGGAVITSATDAIFSITAGGSKTATQNIEAKINGIPGFAGNYTDSITFNVTISSTSQQG